MELVIIHYKGSKVKYLGKKALTSQLEMWKLFFISSRNVKLDMDRLLLNQAKSIKGYLRWDRTRRPNMASDKQTRRKTNWEKS